ncbi:MAG: 4-hydroxy-tetrahydrodipicolinate reductase [Azovibrio sp.]
MQKIGLIGYGKAGKAVASVFAADGGTELSWIVKRSAETPEFSAPAPIRSIQNPLDYEMLFAHHPVDVVVDFSSPGSILEYGTAAARHGVAILSANSSHSQTQLNFARRLGRRVPVMCSPNITLGINFLMIAAKVLQKIAPSVDIAIIEEHFRDKPEISGTAKKIARELDINMSDITSLRLGGIVGHHQVVFGFPYQTLRFVHDSISREAFGTGALFALGLLRKQPPGFYSLETLMQQQMLDFLQGDAA